MTAPSDEAAAAAVPPPPPPPPAPTGTPPPPPGASAADEAASAAVPPPPPPAGPATAEPTTVATAAAADPAFVADATVTVQRASVWFGHKVALTELSCSFGPGVTGLLGPNGAGKTTLMRAMMGLLPLNEGTVRVLGHDPHRNRDVQRSLAMVPEDEAVPPALTARQLVRYTAALHRVADRDAPDRCLATVALLDVADRRVGGFSKGMRQRAKIAAALVSEPRVLVLDEPLNGADPVQRVALIDLFRALGDQGRTVIVSSHVLHEVERLASRQIVVVRGRLAAAGEHHAIRDALADRPRSVLVRTPRARELAARLVGLDVVRGVTVDGQSVVVSSLRAGELAALLPKVGRDADARLLDVRPLDDSLESVFRELLR
ncbi:MAG TPA: ABC transporter ATP-binding protein [Acidimicrobiales bacterium]|nr:ABC transporter ATP-binding protein [Acidimicrobiales bacterium]